MDPVTIGAALFVALQKEIEGKAVGKAADRLLEAAKHKFRQLVGLLPKKEDEQAKVLVAHVLAEAAAFPPEKAVRVEVLTSTRDRDRNGAVGIWPPDARLAIELLWINHADFPVRISDVTITGRLAEAGRAHEYEGVRRDEFELAARSETRFTMTAPVRVGIAVPTFTEGRAPMDITVKAVVGGPWESGGQATRELYEAGVWLPVFVPPTVQLTDPQDMLMGVEQWFAERFQPFTHGDGPWTYRYAEVEREIGIAAGSLRPLIEVVAEAHYYVYQAGRDTFQIWKGKMVGLLPPREPRLKD